MISLKQLHYALAVQQTLHFKKAAEACAVSQSALSTALNEMEKQLGFQVFERNNKQVLVTPLGKQVLEKARAIKIAMDDLYKLGESQKAPLSYPISIGIIPTISPYLLPMVLPTLNEQYPGLQLNIVEEQSHILVDKVRNGDIDTAILALPYPCDGLLSFRFWEEDFYWVSHKDTQANNSQAEILGSDIDASSLLLLKDGHCLKDQALAACKHPSASQHHLEPTSLSTLIQLVAGKMGSTFVPEMALGQLVNHNPLLQTMHLDEPSPHRSIAFITRPNYSGVNNIEALIKLFKQALADTNSH